MDIDLSFSINYSVDFASIPNGAEEYAELIQSNVEKIIEYTIEEYISESFLTSLDEASLQQMIENVILAECAANSSVAQSEEIQNLIAELSDEVVATVSMSRTPEDIINQMEEIFIDKLQTATRM